MRPPSMQLIRVLSCGLFAASAPAQPDLLWGEQFGTSTDDFCLAMSSDGAGGAIIGGATDGSLAGPNAGSYDIWLGRDDGDGNRLWITQFGTSEFERAQACAPDGAGGAFVAGETTGSLGGQYFGDVDPWIARYDAAGNQLWIKQFGSDTFEILTALLPDESGGIFVGGYTNGSLGGPNEGASDIFVAHYSADGDQTWLVQFGSAGADVLTDLAPDGENGLVLSGYSTGSLGGPNAGIRDALLARYDGDGGRLWIVQLGTGTNDYGTALAPDGSGGVFLLGSTEGDLGGPNAGSRDVYLARYDSTGAQTWITQFGSSAFDVPKSVAADGEGRVLVAGDTEGSLGGVNAGGRDIFCAQYDGAGSRVWIEQLGTADYDSCAAGALPDGADGLFLSGFTAGDLYGPINGPNDIFLARFGPGCYADFTGDGVLDLFDFLGFVNLFNAEDPAADCVDDGVFDLFDFLCFVNAFNAGC